MPALCDTSALCDTPALGDTPALLDTDDEDKDPYDFRDTSSPLKKFSRTSTPGVPRGSGRKKTASLGGVLDAIRREQSVLSPATFSSDSEDEVNIYTLCWYIHFDCCRIST